MIEARLLKVAAILLGGAVVVTFIEMGLGIELKYPLWKRLAYRFTYMVWGGGIIMML